MAVNKNTYRKITNIIIDKIEGGYYHPDMLHDGRVKDSRYGSSGETMFGIDRKAGGSLNTSPEGKIFWKIIDNAGARKNWKWNYKGGSLEAGLKDAADEVMYSQYDSLANKYLTTQAKKIVDSDNRLLFNFIYATWNGSGWFKKFATVINDAVSKGITDKDKLVKIAVNARISNSNSLIRQGGVKIASFIDELKDIKNETSIYTKKHLIPITMMLVGVMGLIYFSYFNKSKIVNLDLKLA